MSRPSLAESIHQLGWQDGWDDGFADARAGHLFGKNHDESAGDDLPAVRNLYRAGYRLGYLEGYPAGIDPELTAPTEQNQTQPPGGERARALLTMGLEETPSSQDVQSAFRRLALIYHPDRLQEAPAEVREEAQKRMRQIAWARELLLR